MPSSTSWSLGAPDASGRRAPVPTGKTETIPADLVIMALGNDSNPIIKGLGTAYRHFEGGTLVVENGAETTLKDVYSGGDATRGGSTAVNAAGDGKIRRHSDCRENPFTGGRDQKIGSPGPEPIRPRRRPNTRFVKRRDIARRYRRNHGKAPMVARSAKARPIRPRAVHPKGE